MMYVELIPLSTQKTFRKNNRILVCISNLNMIQNLMILLLKMTCKYVKIPCNYSHWDHPIGEAQCPRFKTILIRFIRSANTPAYYHLRATTHFISAGGGTCVT